MSNANERMMPNSYEAEQGLLGSILVDGSVFDQISEQVHPDDFYSNGHRVIFETMLALWINRTPIDLITVCDELERVEKMQHVTSRSHLSGDAYIGGLANAVPTSANAQHYAGIVARTALARRLISAAGMIAGLGYESDPQALEKSEQLLFGLHRDNKDATFHSMQAVMGDYMVELDTLYTHRGTLTGVPSGYADIDRLFGGFQRTDLILVAARPSIGKTSLLLSLGYNAALAGRRVALFSLEMGRRQLARRFMSMCSKVDTQRLRTGWIHDEEWKTVMDAHATLGALPLWINDTAGNPIASMRAQLRALAREQQGIDIVMVDYIGLIPPDADASKRDNLVQQVSAISAGLKSLAREFDIPVIAACQLSRGVENRQSKRPQLADLRDSGSLEQDADVVMFIYREDYYAKQEGRKDYAPTHQADILIAKHRNGPTGEVSLYFKEEETMFYPLEASPVVGRENDDDE